MPELRISQAHSSGENSDGFPGVYPSPVGLLDPSILNDSIQAYLADNGYRPVASQYSGGGGSYAGLTGIAPTTEAMGAIAAVGTSQSAARSDHAHGLPGFGTVYPQLLVNLGPNNGNSMLVSRSDHSHGTPPAPILGSVVSETSFGGTSSNGVATTLSRSDHRHANPVTPVTTLAVTNNASVNASTGAVTIVNSLTPTFTSLTAGNVVYSVTAGTGIASTGGQNPSISNTGVLTVTASGNLASSGGQNPAISITATPTFTSVTAANLVYSVTASGNLASSGGQNPAITISATPTFTSLTATTITQGTIQVADTVSVVNNATSARSGGTWTVTNSLTPTFTTAATTGNATVGGTLVVTGNLTAPNVVYSVTANTGVASTGGQNPVITNTGVLSLAVVNNATINASTGALTITNSLTPTFTTVTTTGSTTVDTTLTVSGTSTLSAVNATATTVTTLSASGTLNVTGLSTLAGLNAQATTATTFQASGATTLQTTLNVVGTSTLATLNAQATTTTTLAASGNTSVTGAATLTVGTGATSLGGTLYVTGVGTFGSNIGLPTDGAQINFSNTGTNGRITSSGGVLTISNSAGTAGNPTIQVTSGVGGITLTTPSAQITKVTYAMTVGGTLGVTGLSTLAGLNAQATTTTTLTASAATQINSTLNVTGMSALAGLSAQATSVATLTATGATQINATLGVTGAASIPNRLITTTLGTTPGSYILSRTEHNQGTNQNDYQESLYLYRRATGTDWTTTQWFNGIAIDTSYTTPTTAKTYWRRDPNQNFQTWGTDGIDMFTVNTAGVFTAGTLNATGASNLAALTATTTQINGTLTTTGNAKITTNLTLGDVGFGTANPGLTFAGNASTAYGVAVTATGTYLNASSTIFQRINNSDIMIINGSGMTQNVAGTSTVLGDLSVTRTFTGNVIKSTNIIDGQIQANDHLTFPGFIEDGSFEDRLPSTTTWIINNTGQAAAGGFVIQNDTVGGVVPLTSNSYSGTPGSYYAIHNGSSGSTGQGTDYLLNNVYFPVVGTQPVQAQCVYKSSTGTNGTLTLSVFFYDINGTQVAATAAVDGISSTATGNSYTAMNCTAIAPAAAVRGRIYVKVTGKTVGSWYVDAFTGGAAGGIPNASIDAATKLIDKSIPNIKLNDQIVNARTLASNAIPDPITAQRIFAPSALSCLNILTNNYINMIEDGGFEQNPSSSTTTWNIVNTSGPSSTDNKYQVLNDPPRAHTGNAYLIHNPTPSSDPGGSATIAHAHSNMVVNCKYGDMFYGEVFISSQTNAPPGVLGTNVSALAANGQAGFGFTFHDPAGNVTFVFVPGFNNTPSDGVYVKFSATQTAPMSAANVHLDMAVANHTQAFWLWDDVFLTQVLPGTANTLPHSIDGSLLTLGALNVPSSSTVFTNNITAPNVVYAATGTGNITSTGGQNPVIGIVSNPNFVNLTSTATLTVLNGNSSASSANDQFHFGYANSFNYQHAIKTRHNASAAGTGNALDIYLWRSTDASNAVGSYLALTVDQVLGTSVYGPLTVSNTVAMQQNATVAGALNVSGGTTVGSLTTGSTTLSSTTNQSYGSFNAAGTRNGWAGVSFSSIGNVAMMLNANQTGLHDNQGGSWRWGFAGATTGTAGEWTLNFGNVPAARVNAGTFGSGDSVFSNNLNVNGVLNLASSAVLNMQGKQALLGNDTYLRINQTNAFPNGVWMGGSSQKFGGGNIYVGSYGNNAGNINIIGGSGAAEQNRITLDGTTGNITNVGYSYVYGGGTVNVASNGLVRLGQQGVLGTATTAVGQENSRHEVVFSSYRDAVPNTLGGKATLINRAAPGYSNGIVQYSDLVFSVLSSVPSAYDSTTEFMRLSGYDNDITMQRNLVVPSITLNGQAIQVDSNYAHLAGTETLTGAKTFTNSTQFNAPAVVTVTSGVNSAFNVTNGVDQDINFKITATGAADKYSLISPSTSNRLSLGTNNLERVSVHADGTFIVYNSNGLAAAGSDYNNYYFSVQPMYSGTSMVMNSQGGEFLSTSNGGVLYLGRNKGGGIQLLQPTLVTGQITAQSGMFLNTNQTLVWGDTNHTIKAQNNGVGMDINEVNSLRITTPSTTITGTLTTNGVTSLGALSVGAGQQQHDYGIRSNIGVTGGGTITFDGSGNLTWSSRFIYIGQGSGANASTNGYFDITVPAAGTVVNVDGGAAAQNWTASGVLINAWQALWYVLPIGAANGSVPGNFWVTSYTSAMAPKPATWILLAIRNGDDSTLRVCTGQRLSPGESSVASGNFTSDANYVHISGTETITGAKTFSTTLTAPNVVYSVSGNGNLSSNGGQNPTISMTATPSFSSATIPTLSGNVSVTGNLIASTLASSTANALNSSDFINSSNLTVDTPNFTNDANIMQNRHSGFYQTSPGANNTPDGSNAPQWFNYTVMRHTNPANNYGTQIASRMTGTPGFYFRQFQGGGGTDTTVPGGTWYRFYTTQDAVVTTVAGRSGAVSLSAADISPGTFPTGNYIINSGGGGSFLQARGLSHGATAATSYNDAAMWVYLDGSADTVNSPRIGFHLSGVVASQIGMDRGGIIRTYDNPGTGYAPFYAGNTQANGTFYSTGQASVSSLVIRDSGATLGVSGNYTAMTIYGNRNGWAGIRYNDYDMNWMVNNTQVGAFHENGSWRFGFNGPGSGTAGEWTLNYGNVPAARVNAGTFSGSYSFTGQVAATPGGFIGQRIAIPFHIAGLFTTGLKVPKFIANANITLRYCYAALDSGSGATYSIYVNGASVAGPSAASTTGSTLFDFTDVAINQGDRVAIYVNAAGGSDLSITIDAVTR